MSAHLTDAELAARFSTRVLAKIDRDGPIPDYRPELGPCWLWTAALDGWGYGVIGRGRRGQGNVPAYRAVWEVFVGPCPEGLQPDHLCRVRGCVRPTHLEWVTKRENILRGASTAARYAARSVCDNGGHPLDGLVNTKKSGVVRYCKTCARRKSMAWYRAKKAAA